MIKKVNYKKNSKNFEKAQSFTEYTILISIIVMVLFAMSTMMKRGVQGMIKIAADQVGNQKEGDQMFDDDGHLQSSYTTMRANSEKQIDEVPYGAKTYSFKDIVSLSSNVSINLGFSAEPN